MSVEIDRDGRSKLHYAATQNAAAWKVQRLIDEGCDVNLHDRHGMTPLHFACQEHSLENARVLLAAGAQIDARDKHGNTPLSKAVFSWREGAGSLIELLRSHGADPFAANNHGVSPIRLARTISNYDVRKFFKDLPEEPDQAPGR